MTNSLSAVVIALAACAAVTSDAVAQSAAIPDFSINWVRVASPTGGRTLDPPASGPGPIMDPNDHRGDAVIWVGDATNPILKPHARDAVMKRNAFVKGGGIELPAWSLCWPSSVPQALNLGEGVQFLQTPDQVTIVYQRDAQIRRIDLNRTTHPANLKPSWYGDSIGHYENGNTLVVDTVGLDTRAVVDRFATPRSPKFHIVERYIISPDKQTMTVEFTVDDPDTFNMKWSGRVTYRHTLEPITEDICAENNKDASTGKDYPIPMAARADF